MFDICPPITNLPRGISFIQRQLISNPPWVEALDSLHAASIRQIEYNRDECRSIVLSRSATNTLIRRGSVLSLRIIICIHEIRGNDNGFSIADDDGAAFIGLREIRIICFECAGI